MTRVTAKKEVWLHGQVWKTVIISLTDNKVVNWRPFVTSWAVLAAALIKHCNNMWWQHYFDLLKISETASISTNLKLPVSFNPCSFDLYLLSESEGQCIFYFSCITPEFYLDTVDRRTLVWKWWAEINFIYLSSPFFQNRNAFHLVCNIFFGQLTALF